MAVFKSDDTMAVILKVTAQPSTATSTATW